MDAVEKSIKRHAERLKTKKSPQKMGVPYGCGMGWPEAKDFDTQAAYVAYRRSLDPDYAFGHDGRFWAIV